MSDMYAMLGNAMHDTAQPEPEPLTPMLTAATVSPLLYFLASGYATAGPSASAGVAPTGTPAPVVTGPAAATIVDSIPYVRGRRRHPGRGPQRPAQRVRLIARLLDTGEINQEITVTAAPVLLPVVNKDEVPARRGLRPRAGGRRGGVRRVDAARPARRLHDRRLRLRGAYPGGGLSDWPVSLRRVQHGKPGRRDGDLGQPQIDRDHAGGGLRHALRLRLPRPQPGRGGRAVEGRHEQVPLPVPHHRHQRQARRPTSSSSRSRSTVSRAEAGR